MSWYLVNPIEAASGDGSIDWADITNKPAIPQGANLTNQASAFGQSASDGGAITWARSDHYHALPAAPAVPTGGNIDVNPLNTTVAQGAATTWARSDHRHAIPATPTAADLKAVRYDVNNQGLTTTEQSNARTNIGAGTSNLTIGTASTQAMAGNTAIPSAGNIDTNPLNTSVAQGSATTWARSDHRHAIPATPTAADLSAVRYDINNQGLTSTQQSNARTNIGAGTSNLTIGTGSTQAMAGNTAIPAAQIQSDWTQATNTALDYIKNKPTIPTAANITTAVLDATVVQGSSTSFARADHKHAIPTIPAAQIQSDWNQATNTALDYIKNKPAIPTGANLSGQASAFGQSAANGSSTSFARADHYHALPAAPSASITIIANGTADWDNITTPGYYTATGSSSNHSPTSSSTANGWSVHVFAGTISNNSIIQDAAYYSGNVRYWRQRTSGTWGSWQQYGGSGGGIQPTQGANNRVILGDGSLEYKTGNNGDNLVNELLRGLQTSNNYNDPPKNLNDAWYTTNYYFGTADPTGNIPPVIQANAWHLLINIPHRGGQFEDGALWGYQLFFEPSMQAASNVAKLWIRARQNSSTVWGAWKEIGGGGNYLPLTGGTIDGDLLIRQNLDVLGRTVYYHSTTGYRSPMITFRTPALGTILRFEPLTNNPNIQDMSYPTIYSEPSNGTLIIRGGRPQATGVAEQVLSLNSSNVSIDAGLLSSGVNYNSNFKFECLNTSQDAAFTVQGQFRFRASGGYLYVERLNSSNTWVRATWDNANGRFA